MTDTGPDGLVSVTLSAAVGDGVQTRVIGDYDDEAEYYYVQVCRPDGTAYTDNDYATPTRLTDDNQDNIFTANIYLKANEPYVFLFWADNSTTDIPADLHNVAYKKGSIAFADRVEQTISLNGPTVNATLQHVVAKVTLKTTTNVDASDEITVTIPTTYQAYNVNAEAPITTADNTPFEHTVTNAITGTKDGAEVFSFYALVKDETQNITLTNGSNSQQVTNVPLAPNMHTTLVGDVRNLGLTDVTFTASIDGKWDDTKTEIIGLEIADGGSKYIVSSPAALQAWATEVQNDGAGTCLRHIAYLQQAETAKVMKVVNPRFCAKNDSCAYYRGAEPIVYARGFTCMQKRMLPDQYDKFLWKLIPHFGRNPYYERRSGRRLLSPDEQELIAEVARQAA